MQDWRGFKAAIIVENYFQKSFSTARSPGKKTFACAL
jgi:hypothetical protein